MSRSHVAWIALFSVLLVSDGARTGDAAATDPGASSSDGALGELQIEAYLRELNPGLHVKESERIAAAVVKYSDKYALDPALVLAVIRQESMARPWVRSPKGAVGLMQVMPSMHGVLQVAGNLTNVESNIETGCMILADNIRRLGEARGILAYFWGNRIRGVGYLEDVQAARSEIRRQAAKS